MAGHKWPGHTELLAHLAGVRDVVMMLAAGRFRASFVTWHVSYRDAPRLITPARIVMTGRLTHEALRRIGVGRPRIAVSGLNPHAGEAGAFGREEIETIAPAVDELQKAGIDATGPYPPDTVFRRARLGEFDCVVSMVHDQGHVALKLVAFDKGVNVTLGLPFVRTSVDHGTAYDIAGGGRADESSLAAAVRLAARLVR
jgi:4-hydroxythreonine-4-phosphate dehydrogenase